MAISKIILNGVTQMDVTQDTVASSNLLTGYTATGADGEQVAGAYVPPSAPTLETVTKSYTPTESQQTETITPGSGYDGIAEVDVTVGAISSSYVGSGITRRSSTDLTASGATVTVPAGYYASAASKAVASGSIASGSWSFAKTTNRFNATVSKTVTGGYIASTTTTDTYNFVLEDKTITPSTSQQTATPTGNGYYLNSVTVNAMPSGTAGTPTATKGSVSNNSVSITPSVTNTTGYITGSTISGTAVTVTASELADDGDDVLYGDMLTDLTGTSWSFDVSDADFASRVENLDDGEELDYHVNQSYAKTTLQSQTVTGTATVLSIGGGYVSCGGTEDGAVYENWLSPAVRASSCTFSVSGGTDATNAELIAKLYRIATRTA